MNRKPAITVWIVALVATASLVVAAQAPRFTPVTDEIVRIVRIVRIVLIVRILPRSDGNANAVSE
jgi:AMMECR1 domain-containing protein